MSFNFQIEILDETKVNIDEIGFEKLCYILLALNSKQIYSV